MRLDRHTACQLLFPMDDGKAKLWLRLVDPAGVAEAPKGTCSIWQLFGVSLCQFLDNQLQLGEGQSLMLVQAAKPQFHDRLERLWAVLEKEREEDDEMPMYLSISNGRFAQWTGQEGVFDIRTGEFVAAPAEQQLWVFSIHLPRFAESMWLKLQAIKEGSRESTADLAGKDP